MSRLGLLIFMFAVNSSLAQSRIQVDGALGYAFQNGTVFNGIDTGVSEAFGVRFGINYEKVIKDNILFNGGVFGKYNRSKNQLRAVNIKASYLTYQIPVYLGLRLNSSWSVFGGLSLERHRDLTNNFFRKQIRYDILFKAIRQISTNWNLTFYSHRNITELTSTSTFNSPKNGIYLGLGYSIYTSSKSVMK